MSTNNINNPIDFTLNLTNPISEIYDVYHSAINSKIYPVLSGEFDGATVVIEQFLSNFQGWLPIQWRQDELTSGAIVFSTTTTGDNINLPPYGKFRFVCSNPTALTNIKVSIGY